MSGFRHTRRGASARFSADEARVLSDLATQVATLLTGKDETADDPALRRLLPDAYLDDEESAREYRRFTEDELTDQKVRNALLVTEALSAPPTRKGIEVELDEEGVGAWLRALTDIRLALGVRLDIVDDGPPAVRSDQDVATYSIYGWLGAVQESLVRAIDR